MSESIGQTSEKVTSINADIARINQITQGSGQVNGGAQDLSELAGNINSLIRQFKA